MNELYRERLLRQRLERGVVGRLELLAEVMVIVMVLMLMCL